MTTTTPARIWILATLGLSAAAVVLAVALAPPLGEQPGRALTWLLFAGASMHVASSGWFATSAPVRHHARTHPIRYVAAPAALVAGTATAAALVVPESFAWLVLAFFAWQFFHFQKQNLGMAALAASATGAPSLTRHERLAVSAAGVAGIAGLVSHPRLLQLDIDTHLDAAFLPAASALAVAAIAGAALFLRRRPEHRPLAVSSMYAMALLFFVPVFLFASPYAAVAGLTLAHGFQYLLVMTLVAGGDADPARRTVSLLLLLNIAAVGGVALNVASHAHGADTVQRLVFGAYLGTVMAHFVVDAGLWRLRDEFPRRYLTERIPDLVPPRRQPGA